MPKKRPEDILTPKQLEEVRAAQQALHAYFRAGVGRQRQTAQASGIFASMLSSMAHGRAPISLEAAIALELATEGELRAEVLCPIRADILKRFIKQRQAARA